MLIFGKVVDVYKGREYQGNTPDVVQILDQTGLGRKNMIDVTLQPSAVKELKSLVDQDVLLNFTERSGRGANGSYTLRLDGAVAEPSLLDAITQAGLAFVK
jgi:hypothetical protein